VSLQFEPWGTEANIGLYFFSINVVVSNVTNAVSLLTVVPELTGDGLDVELIPTGTLHRCVTVPCTTENPSYFCTVGDTEFYQVSIDTGGRSASASVLSVIFEDINFISITDAVPIVVSVEGLNTTFSFVVPGGTSLVRYIRVTVSVDFFSPSSSDIVVLAAGKTTVLTAGPPQTLLAQTRFQIQGSGASSVQAVTVSMILLLIVAIVSLAL